MLVEYQKLREEIKLTESTIILERLGKKTLELGPCPFEGNLETSSVYLLLANPHLTAESCVKDHEPTTEDLINWGLWGLQSDAGYSVTKWWRKRLRTFIPDGLSDEIEIQAWKQLSFKVSSIQAIPWASPSFPNKLELASKDTIANLVRDLYEHHKNKIFIICRQRKYWENVLFSNCNPHVSNKVLYLKNPRSSYITENNMLDGWSDVYKALSIEH